MARAYGQQSNPAESAIEAIPPFNHRKFRGPKRKLHGAEGRMHATIFRKIPRNREPHGIDVAMENHPPWAPDPEHCNLQHELGMSVTDNPLHDTISFEKADGSSRKDGIKAHVTDGAVLTYDTSIRVQPGDRFIRELLNGHIEEYVVMDPGFEEGIEGVIYPHYAATVRRSD